MQEKKIYAHELGIDLSTQQETEYFKWLLACLLFGKPIQQEVAKRAYLEFLSEGLIIDELSSRLQAFKGIGPKTVEIFLRDITPIFVRLHT